MTRPALTIKNLAVRCCRLLFFTLTLQLSVAGTNLYAADIVVIANKNIPARELSKLQIKNIFLSKIKTVESTRVRPVMLRKNDITDQFLKDAVGKSPSQFSNYYKKMIFTGRGKPPKKADSEEDMLLYVSSTSGAIGYISRENVTDDVQIVQVAE